MSDVTFSPGPYEPQASYDAPGTTLSMLLDGEFTRAGGLSAFFQPENLTLRERDTINSRLKKAAGGNRVAGALVDVALNPWVWMFAVTTPIGANALAKGGGMIFRSNPQMSRWVAKEAPWLHQIGLGSALTATPKSAVAGAAQAHAAYGDYLVKTLGHYDDELTKLLERNGLTALGEDHVSNLADPIKAAKAREISNLIGWKLEGLDRDRQGVKSLLDFKYFKAEKDAWTEIAADEFKKIHDKRSALSMVDGDSAVPLEAMGLKVEHALRTTTKEMPAWVTPELLDEGLKKYGATDLVGKIREALNHDFDTKFITNGTLDEKKIVNLWRSVRNPLMNGRITGNAADGVDLINKLMGPEASYLIKEGHLTQEAFSEYVRNSFGKGINRETYFPRNVTETLSETGAVQTKEQYLAMVQGRAMKMTGSAVGRVQFERTMHPDDLQELIDYSLNNGHAPTEALDEALIKSMKIKDLALQNKKTVTFGRWGTSEALAKHFQAGAEQTAWYLQSPNAEVRAVLKQELEDRAKAGSIHMETGHKTFDENPFTGEKGVPIDSDPSLVPEGNHPGGGFNLSDVMYQAWSLSPSQYSKDALVHLVIPRAMGRITVQQGAEVNAILATRRAAGEFANSKLGGMIEELGGPGQRTIQGLREFAARPPETPSSGLGRGFTNLLYASHLGLNFAAAITNAAQPWLFGAATLGAENIAKGYSKSFQEMFNYWKERGILKPMMREDEEFALLQKHLKWTNADGENLLGIGPSANMFDTLRGQADKSGGWKGHLMEMMMMPFQQVEWMNRNVIAHAVEALHEAQGPVNRGLLHADVRAMTGSTQFGMDFLTAPIAFQTDHRELTAFGKIAASAPARQFMGFPTRSLTFLLDVAPRLGGGERQWGLTGLTSKSPWAAMVHDGLRGMAISAVGYEVAKNMLKVDISDKLFSASVSQYPQQFINPDKNGSPIPIPPVVELASQAGKFLTTGDLDLLRTIIPRVIPGGVALSRAMGVLPQAPTWASLALGQKTYADWSHPGPDGNIPLYKSDGALVDMRPGPELVYRGMGVDLGKFNEPGKLDRFLIANADEIKQYRSNYIAKMIGNDPLGAEKVAKEMEKRFGVPLTVTRSQIASAQRLRNIPRSERVVQRLPVAARAQYQKLLANDQSRMNLPAEVLQSQLGAKARMPFRTTQTPGMDPATMKELERRISDLKPLPSEKRSFDPHESY